MNVRTTARALAILFTCISSAACTAPIDDGDDLDETALDAEGETVGESEQASTAAPSAYFPLEIRPAYSANGVECLGVPNASNLNNVQLQRMPCSGPETAWRARYAYGGGGARLENYGSEKCLDAGTARAQQFECNSGGSQVFDIEWSGTTFRLYNPAYNRYIHDGTSSYFRLFPRSDPNEARSILDTSNNWWSFDVPGLSQGNVYMQAYPYNKGDNQKYYVRDSPYDPNAKQLVAKHSGKCVEPWGSASDVRLAQVPCSSSLAQRFYLLFDSDTFWYDLATTRNGGGAFYVYSNGYDLRANVNRPAAGVWRLF